MQFLTFHFVGGDAFFTGVVLIFLGLILTVLRRFPGQGAMLRLVVLVGAVLVALSPTALPYWFYMTWTVVLCVWLVVENGVRVIRKRTLWGFRTALGLLTLTAPTWELGWRASQHVERRSGSILYVVGDSLSAGMSGPKEPTWPRQLQQSRDIRVIDLSRAGATTRSALKQAKQVSRVDAVVLIEIGGNDLLGGNGPRQFAAGLEKLLARLHRPGRQLVMLELPLPPFYNGYARIQRQLSRKYEVTLIPRRPLARVLMAENATVDGLHLSEQGHRLLAEMIWRHIEPAFRNR